MVSYEQRTYIVLQDAGTGAKAPNLRIFLRKWSRGLKGKDIIVVTISSSSNVQVIL